MKKIYFAAAKAVTLTEKELAAIVKAGAMKRTIIVKGVENIILGINGHQKMADQFFVNCETKASEIDPMLKAFDQAPAYGDGMSLPVEEPWINARCNDMFVPPALAPTLFDDDNNRSDDEPSVLVFDIETRVKGAILLDDAGEPVLDEKGNKITFTGGKIHEDLPDGSEYHVITNPRVKFGTGAKRVRDQLLMQRAANVDARAHLPRRRSRRMPAIEAMAE